MIAIEAGKNFHARTDWMQKKLKPYLIQALEAATDEALKAMRIHVTETSYKGEPGHSEWRQDVGRELKRLYAEQVDKYLESGVGLESPAMYERVRAMLIAYGSGRYAMSETGSSLNQSPIVAGPYGRMVWNDELTGRHKSESYYGPMPDDFNQFGNDFVHKAADDLKKVIDGVVERAFANLPADLISGCIAQY